MLTQVKQRLSSSGGGVMSVLEDMAMLTFSRSSGSGQLDVKRNVASSRKGRHRAAPLPPSNGAWVGPCRSSCPWGCPWAAPPPSSSSCLRSRSSSGILKQAYRRGKGFYEGGIIHACQSEQSISALQGVLPTRQMIATAL